MHSPRTKQQLQIMALTLGAWAHNQSPPPQRQVSLPSALPGAPPGPGRHGVTRPSGTYTKKQWAAVSTHWASISVPPQM